MKRIDLILYKQRVDSGKHLSLSAATSLVNQALIIDDQLSELVEGLIAMDEKAKKDAGFHENHRCPACGENVGGLSRHDKTCLIVRAKFIKQGCR